MATPDPPVLGAMVTIGLVLWSVGRWTRVRIVGACGLLLALVGSFFLYIALAPMAPTSVPVAIGLFAGTAVLFRLLSTFEQ